MGFEESADEEDFDEIEIEIEVKNHPLVYTLAGFRLILDVLERLGAKEGPIAGADHDVIFLNVPHVDDQFTELHPNSEDGQLLRSLGAYWSPHYDSWIVYV